MTLIKSISGIRGTIGGGIGVNLTPIDVVKFASAYAIYIKSQKAEYLNNRSKGIKDYLGFGISERVKVVIGRDARLSGSMVSGLVANTLIGMGIDVVDLGLSTTPTVEFAVPKEKADGGIILTASHNPKQWNALKLLNHKGEFLNARAGEEILKLADSEDFTYAEVDDLGQYEEKSGYIEKHIKEILKLEMVDVKAIKKANFKVVVDAVNSTGGIAIPELLKALKVKCIKLYCEPNGEFPHNPEPLKEHLKDISELVVKKKADLGIVVDPDVDRLAFISENGEMFGEEYTLVACTDYVLSKKGAGNTVSNLSSTRALRDVTEKYGGSYTASAVGEVNVVEKMKETNAIIGGEGNGGIIYPEAHYGRDALVGIALFLSHLAKKKAPCSVLKDTYPQYFMSKNKIQLTDEINVDDILSKMADKYKNEEVNTIDGVKIDFPTEWIHLRKSNTEPIIRIYTEAKSQVKADELAERFISEIKEII